VSFTWIKSLAMACLLLPTSAFADEEPKKKKGFFIRSPSDKFSMQIGGLIQPRFTAQATLQEQNSGEVHFSIPRGQVKFGGHVFDKAVKYSFQTEWGKGSALIKDLWVEYAAFDGKLSIRAGQYKRPFSRQWLTSAGGQEFVERSITHAYFSPGRDIGFMLHNQYLNSPRVEWAVGLFNGTGYVPWFEGDMAFDRDTYDIIVEKGEFTNIPQIFNPTAVGRIAYNHNDIDAYTEADLEGGKPRFAIGLSTMADFDVDYDQQSGTRHEIDYIFKAHGFSSTGAFFLSTQAEGDFSDQELAAGGYHLQISQVFAEIVQPAVRYASIRRPGANMHTIKGCISFYFFDHNFKIQSDSGITFHQGGQIDLAIRGQVSLMF
jgi:hypothetical protein